METMQANDVAVPDDEPSGIRIVGETTKLKRGVPEIEGFLRAFFQGYEAAVGFSSTFSAMTAAANGLSIGEGPVNTDPLADKLPTIHHYTTTWRALRWMDDNGHRHDLIVLFKLYGHRKPTTVDGWFEATIAPLVTMTDAAEDARAEMAFTRSAPREESLNARLAQAWSERRSGYEVQFWEAAGHVMRLTAKANPSPKATEKLRAWQTVMAQSLQAFTQPDTSLQARLALLTNEDRATTVEDAVHHTLHFSGRESDRQEHDNARRSFIAQAKREATELRQRALMVYQHAREVTRASGR